MTLVLTGQIPSGKTSGVKQGFTKSGKLYRYPNARFKDWREDALCQILAQGIYKKPPLGMPVTLKVEYWPGDRRTRDVPGMQDALFHLIVKAGILQDDGLIYDCHWLRQPMNRQFPKTILTIHEWSGA